MRRKSALCLCREFYEVASFDILFCLVFYFLYSQRFSPLSLTSNGAHSSPLFYFATRFLSWEKNVKLAAESVFPSFFRLTPLGSVFVKRRLKHGRGSLLRLAKAVNRSTGVNPALNYPVVSSNICYLSSLAFNLSSL